MRNITSIIIHCSASPFGDAALIRDWHLARGFKDIGYHYVIGNCYPDSENWKKKLPVPENDGVLEVGRSLEEAGAHVEGHNADSVGICLVGETSFTGKQLRALRELVWELRGRFPHLEIFGHYELDACKTCPNISMPWLRSYLASKPALTVPTVPQV